MKLHERVKHQQAMMDKYDDWVMELSRYLSTPKFRAPETTVQIADIRLRIAELRREMFHAGRWD